MNLNKKSKSTYKWVLAIIIAIVIFISGFVLYQNSIIFKDIVNEIKEYNKYQSFDDVNRRIRCFNKNSNILNSTAIVLSKYPCIIRITKDTIYLYSDVAYEYIIDNDIYIQSSAELNDEEINELKNSNLKNVIENLDVKLIRCYDKYIFFDYALTMFKGLGWIYSIDFSIPQKKEQFLSELEKINERWYTYTD